MSLIRRIGNLLRKNRVTREIEEELAAHLAMRAEDNVASGMSPQQAQRNARVRFGNPAAVRERTVAADAVLLIESVWADVRFALRQLMKSPGFAIVVVLALSMGIGAASAIFSVLDAVLLRPLPFDHQERLVYPFMKSRQGGSLPSSVLSYYDERAQLKTFDALAGYSTLNRINLEMPTGAVSMPAVKTTDNFFDVFRVAPILGRTYFPGEDQPGRDNVAVLSYEAWQIQFRGNKDIVGKPMQLDGTAYTIVGVMPAGFRFPMFIRGAIYTPLHAPEEWRRARGMHWMRTVGRLKEGVSMEQGQADISRVMAALGHTFPKQEEGHTVQLIPLAAEVNGFGSQDRMTGPMRTLALAVLALLGIACVNVAGLLLARGVKREREMALRAAVGANRRRLIRQMLNESLVLAAAGLLGGVLLSWGLLKALNVFLVEALARGADVSLNAKVVAAAAAIAVATSIAASLAPAMRLSGTDPNAALRSGSSGAGIGSGQHRLRSGFVITQVALSMVLLVISGLLLRSLSDKLHTDLGFDVKRILAVSIDLSRGRYESRDPLTSFYDPLLEKVGQLSGVKTSGLISLLPIAEWGDGYDIHITGQPPYPQNAPAGAETRYVSRGYFDTMGLKIIEGRALSPELDRFKDSVQNQSSKMVVNDAFRRRFFPGGGPAAGAHIDDDPKPEFKSEIVGVSTSLRQDMASPPMPEMDWLIEGLPPTKRVDPLRSMFLMVRTDGDPKALIPAIREAMRQVDATVSMRAVPMEGVLSDQLIFDRLQSWLFGIFAGFALLLAIIGLYGLISHEVELRTREIGIRMALGSTRGLVMRQVMRRVAILLVCGMAAGWVLAIALSRLLASVVAIHTSADFALMTALTVGMLAVGLLTSLGPARGAASIEPMQALRAD